jgi:hypothetical protein
VAAGGDAGLSVVAAQVSDGRRRAVFLLRMGGLEAHAARTCRVLDHETDARILHCVADGDRLVRLNLIDVTRVITHRQGWLSLETEAPFSDLHIAVDGSFIDLQAAAPVSTLRLRGVSASHRVRLNGREHADVTPATPDTLLIHPGDWAPTPPPAPPRPWSDSGAAFAEH